MEVENVSSDKKVHLRESKMHTARCVASTHFAGLCLGSSRWTSPVLSWWGVAQQSCPGWGVPQSWPGGTPVLFWLMGYSSPVLAGGTQDRGLPLPGTGKDLEPKTRERTCDWGTPRRDLWPVTGAPPIKDMGPVVGSIMGWRWGNPPSRGVNWQTETSTFRHLSDASGN